MSWRGDLLRGGIDTDGKIANFYQALPKLLGVQLTTATLLNAAANRCNDATIATAGNYCLRVARGVYDFAVQGGAKSTISLGVTVPKGSVILGGVVDVETTCTSATDKATISIQSEAADDIVKAVAIETGTPWDKGRQAIIPDYTAGKCVKLTADAILKSVIATEAVTAGKFVCHLVYVLGT